MKHKKGRLEVICGSMFSGKTEELLRLQRRAQYAYLSVWLARHTFDDRYSSDAVMSHDKNGSIANFIVGDSKSLAEKFYQAVAIYKMPEVLFIDEVQFFDDGIIAFIKELVESGVRVVVAGLDTDFKMEPFGPIPYLMAIADDVTKLHAICVVCGSEAQLTQRIVNGHPASVTDSVILVGAQESYEARCRDCHEISVPAQEDLESN